MLGFGYAGTVSVTRPLVAHYTGGRWIIVDTPYNGAAPFVALNAVACVGWQCWAVGSSGIGEPTLLEYFTGSTWVIGAQSRVGGCARGDLSKR